MASVRGILNIQSLIELTYEKMMCRFLLPMNPGRPRAARRRGRMTVDSHIETAGPRGLPVVRVRRVRWAPRLSVSRLRSPAGAAAGRPRARAVLGRAAPRRSTSRDGPLRNRSADATAV